MQRVKPKLTWLYLAYILLFIPLIAEIAFGILRGVETLIIAPGAMFISFEFSYFATPFESTIEKRIVNVKNLARAKRCLRNCINSSSIGLLLLGSYCFFKLFSSNSKIHLLLQTVEFGIIICGVLFLVNAAILILFMKAHETRKG